MSTFYKLSVQRIERDPDFDEKWRKWSRENGTIGGYMDRSGEPQREIQAGSALEAELTADEFLELRDAVVAQWK